ncbi:hypothetical protein HRbin02_00567 [Candidatus Calditenuaceae archaeon HR02]|nr:hypothetical protein HRbin02_00567 [Candidatus Calditenuaceae archaeon HR02]
MDRVARGILEVVVGLGVGVVPTLAALTLVALGLTSSPLVQGLMTELAGSFSVNLVLSILACPVVVLGLRDFRGGLRARAGQINMESEASREIPASR